MKAGGFLKATDELDRARYSTLAEDFTVLRLVEAAHARNILWRDGPMFVDLDDARNGPAISGFVDVLSGIKPEQRMQLEAIEAC